MGDYVKISQELPGVSGETQRRPPETAQKPCTVSLGDCSEIPYPGENQRTFKDALETLNIPQVSNRRPTEDFWKLTTGDPLEIPGESA